ncbi:hypothetical protein [Mycolicibacterium tusciae]|jgi:hypothetical protein|uniref:hypothetical protein n=1 Tax=Mycolicibacterium tusciae TaxID=75922 RepID=UPI00024A1ACB|nr:hypothetical protein [Mycolicibacterium tusciae]
MHGVRAFVVIASAVGGVLAVPAGSAGADTKSAQEVISDLQQQGYSVSIDRIGAASMNKCVVTNVRRSQGPPNWVPIFNDDDDYYPFVVRPTASVTLDCSR